MKKSDIARKLRFLPDKLYIKLCYWVKVRRKLNLKSPRSFNEKLQWLKLNDRKPFYTLVTDKYSVREYIKDTIGEKYLIPLLGVWESFAEIDFDKLPEAFVLKCTHDSGSFVICYEKKLFDVEAAKRKINKALKSQFYYIGRERQYKDIKPRIICEQFIGEGNIRPVDYKISCFNGKPDNIMVCCGRETDTVKFYFFDLEWRLLKYNRWGKEAPEDFNIPKPENFDEMIKIAKILSQPYYYVRIDLYNINGQIYFSEITLHPMAGFDAKILREADLLLGKKLDIPITGAKRD
jgi:hypothetical protein